MTEQIKSYILSQTEASTGKVARLFNLEMEEVVKIFEELEQEGIVEKFSGNGYRRVNK